MASIHSDVVTDAVAAAAIATAVVAVVGTGAVASAGSGAGAGAGVDSGFADAAVHMPEYQPRILPTTEAGWSSRALVSEVLEEVGWLDAFLEGRLMDGWQT